MTSKQILDAFSESLMRDERILSARESGMLMSLVQNARNESSSNPEIQTAVNSAIARSVGETVAQRAFTLLGSSIVEQIVAHNGVSAGALPSGLPAVNRSPGPQPPGGPQPPSGPQEQPARTAASAGTPAAGYKPAPRKHAYEASDDAEPACLWKRHCCSRFTGDVRAECVVLDEFLAPQEMRGADSLCSGSRRSVSSPAK